MRESTKIRLKAVGLLLVLIIGAPLFFAIAGLHEKVFAEDRSAPQGTFFWGLKIMGITYIEVIPELWNELKFGVETLER